MKKTLLFASLLLAVCTLISCESEKARYRKMLIDELELARTSLPESLSPGTSIMMTDMRLIGDTIMVWIESSQQDYNLYFSWSVETWNSDRQKARVLECFRNNSDDFQDILLKSETGFKYVFANSETGESFFEVGISPEELLEILRKMENGELQPYTLMEVTRMGIAKMQFPMQIDEDMWVTDAYIDGSNLFYECMIDAEIESSDIEASDIRELKAETLESLRRDVLFTANKDKGVSEGITSSTSSKTTAA